MQPNLLSLYFYVLRVGEHTKPRKQTRTVQFRFKDVLFWENGFSLDPRTTSLETLRTADAATLRIVNQKNGVKNQTTHHERSTKNNEIRTIAILIELIKDLKLTGATDKTLLCAYEWGNSWHHLQDRHISSLVKWSAKKINLNHRGHHPIE